MTYDTHYRNETGGWSDGDGWSDGVRVSLTGMALAVTAGILVAVAYRLGQHGDASNRNALAVAAVLCLVATFALYGINSRLAELRDDLTDLDEELTVSKNAVDEAERRRREAERLAGGEQKTVERLQAELRDLRQKNGELGVMTVKALGSLDPKIEEDDPLLLTWLGQGGDDAKQRDEQRVRNLAEAVAAVCDTSCEHRGEEVEVDGQCHDCFRDIVRWALRAAVAGTETRSERERVTSSVESLVRFERGLRARTAAGRWQYAASNHGGTVQADGKTLLYWPHVEGAADDENAKLAVACVNGWGTLVRALGLDEQTEPVKHLPVDETTYLAEALKDPELRAEFEAARATPETEVPDAT